MTMRRQVQVYVPGSVGWTLMGLFDDPSEAESLADEMLGMYPGAVKVFGESRSDAPSAWYVGPPGSPGMPAGPETA